MKLTKSKLKQLIKEELENVIAEDERDPDLRWVEQMDKIISGAQNLYHATGDTGLRGLLISNFEMTLKRWKEYMKPSQEIEGETLPEELPDEVN